MSRVFRFPAQQIDGNANRLEAGGIGGGKKINLVAGDRSSFCRSRLDWEAQAHAANLVNLNFPQTRMYRCRKLRINVEEEKERHCLNKPQLPYIFQTPPALVCARHLAAAATPTSCLTNYIPWPFFATPPLAALLGSFTESTQKEGLTHIASLIPLTAL